MIEENERRVREFYEATAPGHRQATRGLQSPHVVYDIPEGMPVGAGHFDGLEDVLERFLSNFYGAFDVHFIPEEFITAGEVVVALGRIKGTTRKAAVPVDVPFVHVWTVRDGYLQRLRAFTDTAMLARAWRKIEPLSAVEERSTMKMRAVQIKTPNGPFELVEREIPEPGPEEVRIKVQACGVCHSDALTKQGLWPGIQYPRIPGHEIAGVIHAIGSGVLGWKAGQRVGVGWHGGHCGYCESCRRGEFLTCRVAGQITGISRDGGYADYMIAHSGTVASIPDELSAADAAPLMCAGITTYNALRNSGARAGDLVAILGIGGLGHLGVQFAAKMGFNTVAIARGGDKESLARQLGARHYIDTQTQDPAAELAKLGGAKVILATVTDAKAMTAVLGGLGINGKLLVVGAPSEPLQVPAGLLIGGRRSIAGWPSGTSIDSQDTMAFSAQAGIRSMNEEFPLDRAAEAYERMMSGHAHFRVVITTGN